MVLDYSDCSAPVPFGAVQLLAAAKSIEDEVDAVDINFG
jgi:hypothetical protein